MNVKRRTALEAIKEELSEIASRLEAIRDEEQEAYDYLPDSFREGERGEKMQTAIDELDQLISDLLYGEEHIETAMA